MLIRGGHCVHPSRGLLIRFHSLTVTAKGLSSELVDPNCVSSLLGCFWNQGVRPKGTGEIQCCIVTKAVLSVTRSDILVGICFAQLSAGEIAAAIKFTE